MKSRLLFAGLLFVVPALFAGDLNRGISAYQSKDYKQAEKELREVIADEPENAQALLYLGLTLVDSGKQSEGVGVLTKADELAPGNIEAKIGLAHAQLELKQFDKAEAAINQAKDINADNADVHYYNGLLLFNRKQYDGAKDELEQAVSIKKDHAYAHYYAGLAYNSLKRPDKMVMHFEAFLKLAPNAPEAKKVESVLRSVR